MSSYAGQTTGMGFQAFGALVQGQNTANVLNQQAEIQRQNATQALQAAKLNADKQTMMATKHLGNISAEYAAGGVDQSSGSVLAVLGASAANAELDRQNIIHGGDIRAVNFQNQASIDANNANNAVKASYFNALSAMVAGGAGMLSQGSGGSSKGGGGASQAEMDQGYDQVNAGSGESEMLGATGGTAEFGAEDLAFA